jgi:simple sugar transport system ATP-binding protein
MFGLKTKPDGPASRRDGQPQAGRRAGDGGPVIECKDVKKTFGGVRALKGASISLYPGEVVALVGDNGAGKSTLVKILGGTYTPDSGSIVIDETVLTHLTPHQASQHGIEVVYQDLALCDNLTADGNIVLGREPVRFTFLGLRFTDGKRAKQVGREQIARLGAQVPNWDMPVRQLSGGQRQALAIARAMISGHRLIVLDEPTAALGVKQTQATLELVRSIAAQNVAVMLIMHNLDQIFEVSDRIVVLRHGAICLNKKVAGTSKEEVVAHMTGLNVGTTGASE